MGFSKKNLNVLKIAEAVKFAQESVSNCMISLKCFFHPKSEAFWQEVRGIFNAGNIRKYDEEGVFFREKLFTFLKAFVLQKLEGAKYAGGNQPSCLLAPYCE